MEMKPCKRYLRKLVPLCRQERDLKWTNFGLESDRERECGYACSQQIAANVDIFEAYEMASKGSRELELHGFL